MSRLYLTAQSICKISLTSADVHIFTSLSTSVRSQQRSQALAVKTMGATLTGVHVEQTLVRARGVNKNLNCQHSTLRRDSLSHTEHQLR